MKQSLLILLALFTSTVLLAQAAPTINILDSGRKVSLRGLSVVDNNTIWASGNAGTVVRSTDGGKTFTWMQVPGFEQRDFRDIEAFDANTAVLMAAEPAQILRTTDGGNTWKVVFTDTSKGMFLDAMAFADDKKGMVVGDPIDRKAYLATTKDGGQSWQPVNTKDYPTLWEKEAFIASSGTNIQVLNNKPEYVMVTGGESSRMIVNKKYDGLPISGGKESTGANSVAVSPSGDYAVVVGGDYTKGRVNTGNCILVDIYEKTTDAYGQKHKFNQCVVNPHGYRSCVIYVDEHTLYTCGLSGVDMSTDGGSSWELISASSFHVVQKAKKGNAVFLAGSGGKIAKIQ